MANDEVSCPNCDRRIESEDDVETGDELREFQVDDDGRISPYRDKTHDLFLCKGCKRPLGFRRD